MKDKKSEKDLQKQLEENTDQLKRLQAEFENHIKRNEKEKLITIELANANLIKKILPVIDDFENTIKHLENNEIKEGIQILFNNFMNVLEEAGLKEISCKGVLDPFLHEVVLQEPSDEPEGTIINEVQKGYLFKDKVIRPSKVIIAGIKTNCLKCKYYMKKGSECNVDACVNEEYIRQNKSKLNKKDVKYIAFGTKELPKSCSFFENQDSEVN